ncbi:MAG: transcriptional regulator GcvA [Steroidobacteraceae bacterium]
MAKTRRRVKRQLPLNALRVLDVCARHLSFTKGSRELRVTQAAVSHQIALLENYLGVRLFRRSGRGVVLTEAGSAYLGAVREALAHLEQATARLRAGHSAKSVDCSIATTIAMRWLVPRLRGFSIQYPQIAIRLNLTERFVNFATETVDVAIRYGTGSWPGLVGDLLFREVLVPVCSPDVLRGKPGLAGPEDLNVHTLLHASASLRDWDDWLAARGVTGVDTRSGLIFDQPHLAMQAAADGLGVALADRCLVQQDLSNGRLVIPFEGVLARAEGYYVVGTAATRDSLHAGTFWQWLLAQAMDGIVEHTAALQAFGQ